MNNRIRPHTRPSLSAQRRLHAFKGMEVRLRPNQKKAVVNSLQKHIPDLLTLSRVLLGFALLLSGLVDGRANLGRDIWFLVLAWSTDMVDGRLSRSLGINGRTWLGKNDVYVDMFVSIALLLYMVVTGLLPLWAMAAYLLVWGALFLRFGILDLFAQVFQNPIYAYFLFLTLRAEPSLLPWLLLWALAGLLLFWRRLFELGRNGISTLTGRKR